jgi:putative transcriptional regulator
MKKYKSAIKEVIHKTVEDFFEVGGVTQQTMREFDKRCLLPEGIYAPEDIKRIRAKTKLSQPVFASYIKISKGLLSDWERGIKKPSGTCETLLSIIEKHGVEIIPTRSSAHENHAD